MRAIGVEFQRELDIVVDDHGHAECLCQRDDRLGMGAVALLAPVLEEGDAALEREAHLRRIDAFRRDRVKTAQLHRRWERCGRSGPPPARKTAAPGLPPESCPSRPPTARRAPPAKRAGVAEGGGPP